MSSKLPIYTPPSPFTPFLRRFTDERARDLADTKRLYDEVTARHRASRWSEDNIIDELAMAILGAIDVLVPECLVPPLYYATVEILKLETPIFASPKHDPHGGARQPAVRRRPGRR